MNIISNLDLLSVGAVVALSCVMGFTVYFSNKKSLTNRIFLAFSLITALWAIANYTVYHVNNSNEALWAIRLIVFISVSQAFSSYELFLAFPDDKFKFSKFNNFFLIPFSIITAILTLTPFVFINVHDFQIGKIPIPIQNRGILLFVSVAFFLVLGTIINIIKKIYNAKFGSDRRALIIILLGFSFSYTTILCLNLILPVFFHRIDFIPLSSLVVFPSIAFTAYSILRHKLLNIQSAKAIILVLILLTITFLEVLYSKTLVEIILRSVIFLFTTASSIFLLKFVVQQAKQKLEIQNLAINLEKANNNLKELDQLKSEFVSLATHNIGSPLTAVNGYLSLLKEEYSDGLSKEGINALATAQQSTNNLINIIRDFVDISRLEGDKVIYTYSQFKINELLDEIVNEFGIKATSKGLKFIHGNFFVSVINADREKIKQAFSNIIDSSVRYSSHGLIEISLDIVDESCMIKISDTSIRNVPSMSVSLTNKFSSDGNSDEANIIGQGLGLYVAKQYIEANNGTMLIQSTKKGTLFTIKLPSKNDL